MILRPGLVLADTSYGGSSLARALAALPMMRPVVGDGTQLFNPIHAEDLARVIAQALQDPLPHGPYEIGGPEDVTQDQMGAAFRSFLGRRDVPTLKLPVALARAFGRVGDALRMGPISANAVDQLQTGVHAKTSAALRPLMTDVRPFSQFVQHRPAGTQDLWHARLYLMRPAVRLVLAVLWIASGLLGLLLPSDAFLPLVPGWPEGLMVALARLGGIADLAIAWARLQDWRPRLLVWVQLALVGGYTGVFTLLAPELWLLPLGGLLKNLPILILIPLHGLLAEER